jgi:hypothetical protein
MKPFPHLPVSCQVGKRRWKVICRSGSVCRSANHLAVVYRHHQLKLVESVRNIANLRFIENTCCTGTHHTDFTAPFNMCEWISWVSAPLSNGDLVKNKAPKHRVKHGVPMLKPCCPAMGCSKQHAPFLLGSTSVIKHLLEFLYWKALNLGNWCKISLQPIRSSRHPLVITSRN